MYCARIVEQDEAELRISTPRRRATTSGNAVISTIIDTTLHLMADRIEYHRSRNRLTPVMPVRLPSQWHHDQIRDAATEADMTLSAWVRNAISKALEDQQRSRTAK